MITVEHLTKCYGDIIAVNDISFEIHDGHVYGLLGANGAGKSTTMNIMTGCLSATKGKVLIDGYDIFEQPNLAKKQIGYLPEQPPLYLNESPFEYLRFVAEAKGLRGKTLTEQVEWVIEQTKLQDVKYRRIGELSKGYKQRAGIAQALLGNPKVIILDEPTVGLDPIQIIEIRDLIKELGKTHTVIFSSHILSEVQTICDQVLILGRGKLLAQGDVIQLQQQVMSSGMIRLVTEADEETAKAILSDLPSIHDIETKTDGSYLKITVKTDSGSIYDISKQIFHAFVSHNQVLLEMSHKKTDLEDIFLELNEEKIDHKEVKDHDRRMEA